MVNLIIAIRTLQGRQTGMAWKKWSVSPKPGIRPENLLNSRSLLKKYANGGILYIFVQQSRPPSCSETTPERRVGGSCLKTQEVPSSHHFAGFFGLDHYPLFANIETALRPGLVCNRERDLLAQDSVDRFGSSRTLKWISLTGQPDSPWNSIATSCSHNATSQGGDSR